MTERAVAPSTSQLEHPETDPAIRNYIEEFAIAIEGEGLPRMAGRIFGYLLVCNPPERTAAQLARELGASIGSISTMTRLLVAAELIERVSRPGIRADLFRTTPGSVSSLMRGATARITRFRRLTERGIALLEDRPPAEQARLRAFHEVYVFFEEQMPALIGEWERGRRVETSR